MSHFRRLARPARLIAIGAGSVLLITACAGAPLIGRVGSDPISATDAWVRYTGPGVPAGGFMVLANDGDQDDALVSASSPAFGSVELHETVEGSDGMMAMRPVTSIPLAAGGTTELRPGSYHLMLFDPTGEVEVGRSVEISLNFEQGGTVTVQAEVQAP